MKNWMNEVKTRGSELQAVGYLSKASPNVWQITIDKVYLKYPQGMEDVRYVLCIFAK